MLDRLAADRRLAELVTEGQQIDEELARIAAEASALDPFVSDIRVEAAGRVVSGRPRACATPTSSPSIAGSMR